MKRIKRFLLMCLLFPILPIFRADGDNTGGADDKGSDKGTDGKGTDDKGTDDKGSKGADDKGTDDKGSKGADVKTFTQEQIDNMINKRLSQAKKNWDQEAKDKAEKDKMSETEKLKAEKDEAIKKGNEAKTRADSRLIRAEVMVEATKMGIVDPDAAYALMKRDDIEVKDDDTVTGVKEALATLITTKPYLVSKDGLGISKTGDDQGNDKSKKGGFSMNDLIRKAAGRN